MKWLSGILIVLLIGKFYRVNKFKVNKIRQSQQKNPSNFKKFNKTSHVLSNSENTIEGEVNSENDNPWLSDREQKAASRKQSFRS